MARLARIVLPYIPHHVTQRGNGRVRTFFGDTDYRRYRDLLAEHCRRYGIGIANYGDRITVTVHLIGWYHNHG